MAKSLPHGVMSAHRARARVLKGPRGTFVGVKRVHLVLTTRLGNSWPLPLWKVGRMISLPAER